MSDTPNWSNKTLAGSYGTYSAMQVFQSLGLEAFSLPTPIVLLLQGLPSTATMVGGQLVGALLNVPYNDIDIWCLKGSGSPHDDTVAAVQQTLTLPTFTPGNYAQRVSNGGTTIFASDTMPAIMVHRVVFDTLDALLDCVDFTVNQLATVGVASFRLGPTTILDLSTKTLRYGQPPIASSPLIKELRDLRLRKYIQRGFKPDPSVAEGIRSYSPLLANQLQAQRVLDALKHPEDAEPSSPVLPPVKPPVFSSSSEPKPSEPSAPAVQVPVVDPTPKVESRVMDNEFMKQFASSLLSK